MRLLELGVERKEIVSREGHIFEILRKFRCFIGCIVAEVVKIKVREFGRFGKAHLLRRR